MGMTLAEKILAAHCGRDEVSPGELVNCRVDFVMSNDVTAPLAIREFRKLGVERVFDRQRVAFIPSHFIPNKDIQSAENAKYMREFALAQGAVYYEQGRAGVDHVLLPDHGWVLPGDVVVGADSHTCTYGALGCFATGMGSTDIACAMATGDIWMRVPASIKLVYHGRLGRWVGGKDIILHTIGDIGVDGALYCAMEFHGEALSALGIEGRFTISNMAVEAGGKVGLMVPDEKTLEYVRARAKREWKVYQPDPDAQYQEVREYDLSTLEPMVSLPSSPANAVPLSKAPRVEIDQVFIGSCTNGRLADLRLAAEVIRGRKVHERVRCIVVPASHDVYLQALKEGLLEMFAEAGCAVSTTTCGPCLGGYMGVLAEGERCVSTSNRNFPGRMGHVRSEVYLANPAVAAASAVAGRLAGPEEVTR
ncbi:MAG: 3-isopropylmalate dehydratase large subunit [Dehalococcoidia bacterium]|nr:3-isopropylmalate dehydratase large subunit [Dehalococcoidia bacterium]